MKQADIIAAVSGGQAEFKWVPLTPDVEVMAWPVRINDLFVGVSARTAQACAQALSRDGWLVSLTTPKIEDMIYESAAARPEPVTLNPQKVNIASDAAIAEHSAKLRARLGSTAENALVACGKNWVQTEKLRAHPGRAANYGFFSAGAPSLSENRKHKLWQPLSFAHNPDHFDYSQLLRLARRKPGVELPSYEAPSAEASAPAPVVPPPSEADMQASSSIAHGTLGERCVAWCLEEAQTHERPDAERIAYYHAVAVRNGKPLGIKAGNFCASAQSRALVECLLLGDVKPHEPRAGAIELLSDALHGGRFHGAAEVRARKWLPRPGDLAIYDRSNPADPKTSWLRHVDRVIRVSDDQTQYENIGANELGGAWRREWSPFSHPKLLGFVAYPGLPLTDAERAVASIALPVDAVG
jgi:hypothetical protein